MLDLGAVVFGMMSNHVASVNIGYNAMDLFLNAYLESFMLKWFFVWFEFR